jgi:hypothetical protein
MTNSCLTRTLLIVSLALPTVATARIPPFCTYVRLPPATCDSRVTRPCDEACASDPLNGFPAWVEYWKTCGKALPEPKSPLDDWHFMCARPQSTEVHMVYYNPASAWVCCSKNPFE